MEIKIGEKFTSKNLDEIYSTYWQQSVDAPKNEKIEIDLTKLTWIALEELNFLFGWIRYLIVLGKPVFVKFAPLNPTNERLFKRIVSLWHRWKIYSLTPFNQRTGQYEVGTYFNVSTNINTIITQELINDQYRQLYNDNNWHKVIPFHFIDANYQDDFRLLRETLNNEIDDIFQIEKEIEELLNRETCYSPFQNKTLSKIITTELYLNVIHHSFDKESKNPKECYLSIALNNARSPEKYIQQQAKLGLTYTLQQAKYKIQQQIGSTIEFEKCHEEKEFFRAANGDVRNESFIEFSFLDFGKGVVNTLLDRFTDDIRKSEFQDKLRSFAESKNLDTQIIEYAFLLQTSRNKFKDNIALQNYIPRGLYFLVDIVKRYNGMLIVRSGKGKVIFDFKTFKFDDYIKRSNLEFVRFSANDSELPDFKGTLYTLIIPATKEIQINAIQAESSLVETKKLSAPYRYIDINKIFQDVLNEHEGPLTLHDIYDYIFVSLNKMLEKYSDQKCILILDFQHVDNNVVDQKLYYFLCHHPLINSVCNAVIVNPPDKSILKDIQRSLYAQDLPLLRPIPCVVSPKEIVWLGLKNIEHEPLLNQYWHFEHKPSISAHDFGPTKWSDIEKLKGNIIQFDKLGNMEFSIPDFGNFWRFLKVEKPKEELLDLLNNPTEEILLGEKTIK